MSLRFYHYVEHTASPAGQKGAMGGNEQQESSKTDKKDEVNGFSTYVDRAVRLLPGEVLVFYPMSQSILASVPNEDIKHSSSALACLFITGWIRTKAIPEGSRPQPQVLGVSMLICLLWIYSMGGYLIWQIPEGYTAYPTWILAIVGLLFPAGFKGEKRIKQDGD